MPITGTLAMVAAASMAGLPLLNGFLSKEMMLEAAAHTDYLGSPWLVPALATAGRAALGRLLVPLRHRRVPRPDARRLPAPSARSAARHVAAGRGAGGAGGADRRGAGAGRAAGRPRRRCRGRRTAARLSSGALARTDAGLVHDRGGARRRPAAARGLPPGLARAARHCRRPEAKAIFDPRDRQCRRRGTRASPMPSTTARCSAACCWRSWSCSALGLTAFLGGTHGAGARARPCRSPCRRWPLWLLVRGRQRLAVSALASPSPAGAGPDQRRRARGLADLRLLLRPRPRPDPALGRGGDHDPDAAGAQLPAAEDAARALAPAALARPRRSPPPAGWRSAPHSTPCSPATSPRPSPPGTSSSPSPAAAAPTSST